MMKSLPSGYSHYDIPELEETEFALSVSPCPLIEDSGDMGDISDSFSIGAIIADALFREFNGQ
jgi:hypothetical protein